MPRNNKNTAQRRIRILLPILAAALPAFGLAIWLVVQGADAHRDQVVERYELRAVTTSFALEQVVKNQVAEAELVATSPLVTSLGDPDALRRHLRGVLEVVPHWDMLAVADREGAPIAAAPNGEEAISAGDRAYIQKAIASAEPVVGGPVVHGARGDAAIRVAVPVAAADGSSAAVLASIPMEWLHDAVADHIPSQSHVQLVDRERDLYVEAGWQDPPRPAAEREDATSYALRGDVGAAVTQDQDGETIVAAYAPIPERGWTVLLSTPASYAFRHADDRLRTGLWLAVLALGAISVLSWSFGGRLAATMQRTDRARGRAETSRRRAALVAEASRSLSVHDSYERTIPEVVRLASAELGARCVVELMSEEGGTRRLSLEKGDAAHGADGPLPSGLAEVVKSSRGSLQRGRAHVTEVDDGGDGKPATVLIAPLARSERLLGWMVFAVPVGRVFEDEELALVEDLGSRMAMAIANAELYRKARESTQAREHLLSVVAHDLRSPLTAIDLSAASVERAPEVPPTVRSQIERIRRSSVRMQRLIADLLDAARNDPAALCAQPGPHAAASLLEESAEAYQPLAAERDIRLRAEPTPGAPTVWCDRARVEQVLSNIVSNAIRFSRAGGEVVLRAELAGGHVLFEVCDSGPGIPAKDLPRIFERYWHGGNIGGTGLGLAIAKAIVEAHSGRIWAENTAGGAALRFTVPVADSEASEPAPPGPSSTSPDDAQGTAGSDDRKG